jgi:iron-sulfur cluster repair protein YtfE (RIC family)
MQEVPNGSRQFHQHERLEQALSRLEWTLRVGDEDHARLHLAMFKARLDQYVEGEERLVFPMLERLVPAQLAPIAKMRREHASLRELLEDVWDAVDAEHARRLDAFGILRSVLMLHVAKEEWFLYPLLVRSGSSTSAEALLRFF